MKHCNTCDTDKPKAEFHARKASKDGLSPKCRLCAKAYDDARANDPRRVAARLQYSKTEGGIEAKSRAVVEWIKRNPKKRSAHTWLGNAVRDGKITKKPCEICGATYRIHGHHDDYDKIYDVRWLCAQHHTDWHKINGEAANPR
jgi:hypothetical protein